MFKERRYRQWVESDDLVSFEVKEKETDLFILAEKKLEEQARESVLNARTDIERYIRKDAEFLTSLAPVAVSEKAPRIIVAMAEAALAAGVGPMAAVAGAVAETVGMDLMAFSRQVIVENGGDIFVRTMKKRTLGIYAGENSPFTGKLAMEIGPSEEGLGVCTSSGTVSHSLSFGKADAVVVIAESASLADAVATAAANMVKSPYNMEEGIEFAKSVEGVKGALILIGDKMASWGAIKLV